MKREEIKAIIEGITPEQLDKIMAINGSDIEKAKGDLATYKQQVENLNSQIADRDSQLKELKDSNKDNEKLQAKIEALEKANADSKTEYEKQIEAIKRDNENELKIRDAKAKNVKAVKALLNDESPIEDQLKALREDESTSFLFEADKVIEPPKGTTPKTGGENPAGGETPSLASAIGKALKF